MTAGLDHWTARRLQPVVLLYLAAVFAAMMAVSHFAFHSTTAVRALAMAAVGSIVPLVPAAVSRLEYRLTERGLEQRSLNARKPGEFRTVLEFDQLSHIIPTGHGFKYHLRLSDASTLKRFWKAHVSDAFSGEVHVERTDRDRVLEALTSHGVPIRRSTAS